MGYEHESHTHSLLTQMTVETTVDQRWSLECTTVAHVLRLDALRLGLQPASCVPDSPDAGQVRNTCPARDMSTCAFWCAHAAGPGRGASLCNALWWRPPRCSTGLARLQRCTAGARRSWAPRRCGSSRPKPPRACSSWRTAATTAPLTSGRSPLRALSASGCRRRCESPRRRCGRDGPSLR